MTQARVYLFSTCLIEHIYPQIGFEAMSLLELCGYQCEIPLAQTCCGQPAYNSGAIADGRAVAEHTLKTFSNEQLPLIVPSASCADMIKNQYPQLFPAGSKQHQQAVALASRCFEFIDFIADKLPAPPSGQEPKHMTLHISCSARRGTKTYPAWHRVLEKAFGAKALEPNDAAECCGFGGTFSVKSPEVSTVMAEDKCQALMQTGIKTKTKENNESFCSGDCGCLMHLNAYAEKQNLPLAGQHIISVLAQRYGVADAERL